MSGIKLYFRFETQPHEEPGVLIENMTKAVRQVAPDITYHHCYVAIPIASPTEQRSTFFKVEVRSAVRTDAEIVNTFEQLGYKSDSALAAEFSDSETV